MTAPKILVIGSSNTDMVIQTDRLPTPGETVLGGEFLMNPGGKGANQAVAAARLGGKVSFVSRVGTDIFGQEAIEGFQQSGIDTQFVFQDSTAPSGIALILVNQEGENSIAVAPGANGLLRPADIDSIPLNQLVIDFLLMQLEVPIDTVEHAARRAHAMGIKTVLNPAPAQKLSDHLIQQLFMITPNETEAYLLTGVEVHDEPSAHEAANMLQDKGVEIVIITMGAYGAFVKSRDFTGLVPPPEVRPIDTTAAGDTFNGALVVALGMGKTLEEAVRFANCAAALSTTKMGAQASIPAFAEVEGLFYG
ncbi:MAG: ribokinase [Bacteroidota bacterium]